jgi:hypothetical protein
MKMVGLLVAFMTPFFQCHPSLGQLYSSYLNKTKGKKSKRQAAEDASNALQPERVSGKLTGSITGVDLCHLLLLLPFLLFDLMDQEINAYNGSNNSHLINPAN